MAKWTAEKKIRLSPFARCTQISSLPSSKLFIMEARECKKVHFDLNEGKQIATQPMNLCHALVSQSHERVSKGVAYQLIGSFRGFEKSMGKSSISSCSLSVINLRSGKSVSLLSLCAGSADKSNDRAQWDSGSIFSPSTMKFRHKEIQLLYHFPRIFVESFFSRR